MLRRSPSNIQDMIRQLMEQMQAAQPQPSIGGGELEEAPTDAPLQIERPGMTRWPSPQPQPVERLPFPGKPQRSGFPMMPQPSSNPWMPKPQPEQPQEFDEMPSVPGVQGMPRIQPSPRPKNYGVTPNILEAIKRRSQGGGRRRRQA